MYMVNLVTPLPQTLYQQCEVATLGNETEDTKRVCESWHHYRLSLSHLVRLLPR